MFMLVRREAMEQVGLLDEDYFVYTEEADWCYRFSQAGWRRVFTPCARIIHLDGGSKSTSQVNTKMFVQLQKSSMIYFRKHLGLRGWLAGKVIFVLSNFVRAVAWSCSAVATRNPSLRRKSAAAAAALRFHLLGLEVI